MDTRFIRAAIAALFVISTLLISPSSVQSQSETPATEVVRLIHPDDYVPIDQNWPITKREYNKYSDPKKRKIV